MQTNYEKVREFREHFPNNLTLEGQFHLIEEEFNEVTDEIFTKMYPGGFLVLKDNIDRRKLAKELADLEYVIHDMALSLNIDQDRSFDEVHKSNMSKLGEDGKPVYREDGKVLKGPNYQPPKLDWITK